MAAFVLVLGGVTFFRASGAGRLMEPVQPKAEFDGGVAQLELPGSDPSASRVVASVAALQRDVDAHVELAHARASAFVEFRDPNGGVRADAFGAWIDESDELHPLVVGEDGTSPVPARRATQLVASAPHSLTIVQRLEALEALEAGAVETIEFGARPRIRMRVTVDGAPPGERIRFPMNVGGVELAGGIHGMGLRAREALERLGLIQRFAPMETDFRGLIDVEYPAELKRLMLGTPQGGLVSTINGETGPGVTGVVIALPGPGVTTVDLRALPRVRTFAGAGPGQAAEQFFEFQTNASGRFSIRMHEGADGRAAVSVGLEALDRAAVPRDRRTFQVDPLAMTQEVGDLRVQQPSSVRVRIMGERGESWVPLVPLRALPSRMLTGPTGPPPLRSVVFLALAPFGRTGGAI